MKSWTIRRRIVWSFGLILALMVIVGVVAYTRLARVDQETQAVQGVSIPGLYYSMAIQDAWSDDLLLTEEYVLQPDTAQRRRIETKLQSGRAELDKMIANYESTITTAGGRSGFDGFKNVRTTVLRLQDELLRAGSDGKTPQDVLIRLNADVTSEVDKGMNAIQAVVSSNKSNADESGQRIVADVSAVRLGVLAGLVATLLLTLVCGISLRRAAGELTTLVQQVEKSGLQVNTSVTEIAATAKEQQATANEVAATTTEIGATSREISATSKELVKTMADVSSVAEESATLAGTGQAGLAHMEETMRQVMEAASGVNAKLATLNEKAGDISQVVTTITKVADQTNLLSLNAAIEAEKAGEYGRGFAVVATEIRRLADQTAVATYDIDQMVKAIQSAVSAGVMSMDKFSEDVRRGMQAVQEVSGLQTQVIQQVQALAPRFEAVSEGMQTQATGAEQITEALAQLSEAARQTVESLRQSNMAIDELNQVAHGLRNGVEHFTLQVA
jgi:methyl-accepting chemotaxis protein WspA